MSVFLADNDIYIIPAATTEDKYIVYSPLRGVMFWANTNAIEMIDKHFDMGMNALDDCKKLFENLNAMTEKETFSPPLQKVGLSDSLVIVLSQKCNLACSYCYAQEARSTASIDEQKLKIAIDYVLSSQNKKTKGFTFIGGGEPTVTWELFRWAVEYIRSESEKLGVKSAITLATNATLFTNERVSWLKSNDISVSASFDILPEIQNTQRCFPDKSIKSFEIVDAGIKLLIAHGIFPRIRSTITPQNVSLMKDMVAFVVEHYPEIRWLHFEPVTDMQLEQADYYNDYISQFFIAREYARANGLELRNSITHSTGRLKSKFCSGELCVVPTGELVSCHRVSSPGEELFAEFSYGNIEDTILIDSNALENVESCIHSKPLFCSDCFAQWHCAGACPYNRALFTPEQLPLYCEFTKKMIAQELESKLA